MAGLGAIASVTQTLQLMPFQLKSYRILLEVALLLFKLLPTQHAP